MNKTGPAVKIYCHVCPGTKSIIIVTVILLFFIILYFPVSVVLAM